MQEDRDFHTEQLISFGFRFRVSGSEFRVLSLRVSLGVNQTAMRTNKLNY